jgi:predicted PurR-regulated permease PerM
MPDPFLWGAMAGLLNFIPYLRPTMGITIVTVVASITFHDPYRIILPPLAYFVVIGLDGNFITPMIVG